jgi:hypothetical protein
VRLVRSIRAIATAPSHCIGLSPRSMSARVVLVPSDSANAIAPAGPIMLPQRSSSVSDDGGGGGGGGGGSGGGAAASGSTFRYVPPEPEGDDMTRAVGEAAAPDAEHDAADSG